MAGRPQIFPFSIGALKACEVCGRTAARTIDLHDGDAVIGARHVCEEYPFCTMIVERSAADGTSAE